ncbi:ATP-binding protein [Luteimicrobium sp. DT211]|uniref:ATP-binding protein n=1 Tax=Luteimicrobium sp. DT211 TaxID=3393412 RepID=UPI003CF752E9
MQDDGFGAVVRRLRLEADLTLEALAEASGVSDRGIGDIERGVSRAPQRRTVLALADGLGLDDAARTALLEAARDARRRAQDSAAGARLPVPGALGDFTGRADDRRLLASALRASTSGAAPPVVLVSGPPGFGKTALATRVAADLSGDFDAQVFLDLRGLDARPVTPGDVVRRLCAALTGSPSPARVDDAADRLRGALVGRRVLLVLDNAASEEQVRAAVPAAGPAAVLVTSRRTLAGLAGVRRLVLGTLAADDAVALLRRIVPAEAGGSAELARLAALCADVPLALRIAGNRLAVRQGWSVARLVARLGSPDRRLDGLRAGDLQVRAAFSSSFEQLGPGSQRMFRRLSLVGAPSVGTGLAAALSGEPLARAEDLLDELVDLSLVQPAGDDRFALHDLLREFAGSELRAQEGAPAADATRRRADDWLLATAARAGCWFEAAREGAPSAKDDLVVVETADDARHWLVAESDEWLAALRRANDRGDARVVVEVAEALHWFSDLWPHWHGWGEVFGMSAGAARAVGDDLLVATHEGYLAWAEIVTLDDLDAARASARRALDAATRTGDDGALGWAHYYIGWAAEDPAVALVEAREAARRFRAAGDREALPQALLAASDAQSLSGDVDAAVATARELLAALADPATRPRAQVAEFTAASVHAYLVRILGDAGRWEDVLEVAPASVGLAESLGVTRMVANARYWRGRALFELHGPAAAAPDLRRALALREEMGDTAAAAAIRELLERQPATTATPVRPPSTSSTVPWTNAASSDAR